MQHNSVSPGKDKLLEIDKKNIWHPFTSLLSKNEPVLISEAHGLYLHTPDGRKIMDAVSSWWVNLHGHSNPVIATAIADQARKLEHVIFAGFTHEPAITLSENLLKILPSNQSKVFFSDNGSTAVEVALKMSFQYWYNQGIKRTKVIAFKNAYHGDTFGSMAVGSRSAFSAAFDPYLFSVEFIDVPTKHNRQAVTERFRALVATKEVGAFIFEPLVQAASGMIMYEASFLDELINEALMQDVVCIADEVFTGFGRTGKLFASDHLQTKPDIIAMSKGITGGSLPLGVTSCSTRIANAYKDENILKTFFHGHSYTANPITCAAANASYNILMSAECQESLLRITQQHQQFVRRLKDYKIIKDARCLGTIVALELDTSEDTGYFNQIRDHIYSYFLTRDILLRPLGNVIYILPPYIITNEELDQIYNEIEFFIKTVNN